MHSATVTNSMFSVTKMLMRQIRNVPFLSCIILCLQYFFLRAFSTRKSNFTASEVISRDVSLNEMSGYLRRGLCESWLSVIRVRAQFIKLTFIPCHHNSLQRLVKSLCHLVFLFCPILFWQILRAKQKFVCPMT